MQYVKHFITDLCPKYFRNLPVPQSANGWLKLSFYDWIRLMPPSALFAGFWYMVYIAYWPGAQICKPSKLDKCNQRIRKYDNKVIDYIDTENIYEQATLCRCWRTKNWPYCDGSHVAYNLEVADNVGPLIAKRYQQPSPVEETNTDRDSLPRDAASD